MIQTVQTPTQYAFNSDGYLPDNLQPQLKTQPMHRPIPAPEPDPEPNPGPDAIKQFRDGIISATDWDELFHAVQVRLERCVSDALDKQPELALQDRHEVTKVAVLQCVEAMKQLHHSLTLERQQSNQPQQSQQHPPSPQYQ